MRRLAAVLALVFLPGCGRFICPLLGYFVGTFAGDQQGDVLIDVTESDDEEMPDVSIRLTTEDLEVVGSAVVTCDNGRFDAKLETPDNPDFGDFNGGLMDDAGDGEWSFNDPDMSMGTWTIVRMDQ